MATGHDGVPMTGHFRYLADAALFTDCTTGKAFAVAMEKDYLALERAYRASRPAPGAPLLVTVQGHFAERPPMEGDGRVTMLIVDRFEAVHPGKECPPSPAAVPLENTTWKLTGLFGQPVSYTVEGKGVPHLLLRTPERQMSGFSGCNGFFGLYRVDGDRLSFEDMAATMQACPNNPELETSFYKALKATRRFAIRGNVLLLYDQQEEVARFTAIPK